MHTAMQTQTNAYMYIKTRRDIQYMQTENTQINPYTQACIHTHTHTHSYTDTHIIHTHTHTHTHTHIDTHR